MRRRVITSGFLIICISALAQRPIDSLGILLSQTSDDTHKVDLLNQMFKEIYYLNSDSALILAKKAKHLASKIDFEKGLVRSLHNVGTGYQLKTQNDSAVFYYKKSLSLGAEIGDSSIMPKTLNNLGYIYQVNGNFSESLQHYHQALRIRFKTGDSLGASGTILNIGNIYGNQRKFDRSLYYYNLALDIKKSHDDIIGQANVLGSIGTLLSIRGDYEKALTYQSKAFEIFDSLGINKCHRVTPAHNLGSIYRKLGELDTALKYSQLAYEEAIACEDQQLVTSILFNLGLVYDQLGSKKAAENKLLESYLLSKKYDFKYLEKEITDALYYYYKSVANLPKALEYLEYRAELDSVLFNESLTEQTTTMELNFKFEQERDSLKYQKQGEIATINSKLERQVIFKYITISGLLLALVIAIILYRNYRLKQSSNINLKKINEAQEQKLMLETTLRHQQEDLSQFKEGLSHMLVHDMKTPLSAILSLTEERMPNQEDICLINQSAKLILQLANNIMDVQKFEESKMQLKKEIYYVYDMIELAQEQVAFLMKSKNIVLETLVPKKLVMNVDKQIILRVFVNLFTNAIKCSPSSSCLTVSVENAGEQDFEVAVKDQGVGIEDSFLPYIFDKFSQESRRITNHTYSTGLGLTFCKLAIEAHGGSIRASSEMGKGTTFVVTLPTVEPQFDQLVTEAKRFYNSKTVFRDDHNLEDLILLKSIGEKISEIPIYKVGEIEKILSEVSTDSEHVKEWIQTVRRAVLHWDQEQLDQLTKLIVSEY